MRNFLVWSNIRSFSSLLSLVTTKYCSPHILEISEVYERTYCLLQSLKKHCGIIEERWLQIRVCSVTGKNTYEDIELRPWPAVLKPWPNGLASRGASRRKLAKPELAYGLAKGGQTDSKFGSQVAKSRKFHAYHWLMRFYNRLLAINLCRLALGGQTVKKLASTCVQI